MHENQGMVHECAATVVFTSCFNMAAQNVGQDFYVVFNNKGDMIF